MTAITVEVLKQRIAVLEQEARALEAQYDQLAGKIQEDRAWIGWCEEQSRQAGVPDPASIHSPPPAGLDTDGPSSEGETDGQG